MDIDLKYNPPRITDLEEPNVKITASSKGAEIEWSWKHRPGQGETEILQIPASKVESLPSNCLSFELAGEHWECSQNGVWRVACE